MLFDRTFNKFGLFTKNIKKMKLLSNCCSYLRHSFESHSGIKAFKLESYCNFFVYRWPYVGKAGMKNTVEYTFLMVCGTPKGRKYAESF